MRCPARRRKKHGHFYSQDCHSCGVGCGRERTRARLVTTAVSRWTRHGVASCAGATTYTRMGQRPSDSVRRMRLSSMPASSSRGRSAESTTKICAESGRKRRRGCERNNTAGVRPQRAVTRFVYTTHPRVARSSTRQRAAKAPCATHNCIGRCEVTLPQWSHVPLAAARREDYLQAIVTRKLHTLDAHRRADRHVPVRAHRERVERVHNRRFARVVQPRHEDLYVIRTLRAHGAHR